MRVNVYRFAVAVSTHDDLRRGVVARQWRSVAVEAERPLEASLIALRMACGPGEVMPTDIERLP